MAKYYIKNIPHWNYNLGSFKSTPNPDNEKIQTITNILYNLIQRFKGVE